MPIHYKTTGGARNPAELRTEPDDSEPMINSYDDQDHFLNSEFDALEDQVLKGGRGSGPRGGGGGNSSSSMMGSAGSLMAAMTTTTTTTATSPSHSTMATEPVDFHARLQKTQRGRSQDGVSFWRSTSTGGNQNNNNGMASSPAGEAEFRSMNIQNQTTSGGLQLRSSGGGGGGTSSLLGSALQSHHQHHAAASDYNDDRQSSTSSSVEANNFRRFDSAGSSEDGRGNMGGVDGGINAKNNNSNSNNRDASKKQRDMERRAERRLKRDALERNEFESGRVVVELPGAGHQLPNPNDISFVDMMGGRTHSTSLERSSSDQSAGSILYGKTPNSGALLGKSTSLIFPTGMEHGSQDGSTGAGSTMSPSTASHMSGASGGMTMNQYLGGGGGGGGGANSQAALSPQDQADQTAKQRRINLLLDQCESLRFPFKKKLILSNLNMTAADIPLPYLCGTTLGNALHKLSLSCNHLGSIPERLVNSLPSLKHLDLSQCHLHSLPAKWNLPQLKTLNLSDNLLRDFPDEIMLEGLPELHDLNLFGNKIAEITLPHPDRKLLSRLETLNLGYNDIAFLPDELDGLKTLRYLKVRNNFLTKVPMRICDMELKSIDVSSNPVSVPPLETCERGICSMKRYYQQVRLEDQSKGVAMEELQRRVHGRVKKTKEPAKKQRGYGGFMKTLSLAKSPSTSKKHHQKEPTTPLAPPPRSRTVSNNSAVSSNTASSRGNSVGSGTRTASVSAAAAPNSKAPDLPAEALVKPALATESSDEAVTVDGATPYEVQEAYEQLKNQPPPQPEITVNDTLKVIFVGMAMVGKTSMIKRLIEGKHAVVPTHDERTVGVDIYAWDPVKDKRFEHIDSRIQFQDKELAETCGDVDVKLSVWDFAGQHVYHATHELFFSSNALYVLVWDMGATNKSTLKRKSILLRSKSSDYYNYESNTGGGDFKLTYDSESDDEDDDSTLGRDESGRTSSNNVDADEDARRAERALERDIDEKIQFWVDCIQSSAPGAAILPVASFSDYFESNGNDIGDGGGIAEAKRRCNLLKDRLLRHEQRRIEGIERRLQEYKDQNRADDPIAHRLRNLLHPSSRPKLVFGDEEKGEESVVRVSGTQYYGFDLLTERIVNIATGRYMGQWAYPIFHGHVGTRIPRMRLQVREAVRNMRDRFKVVEWGYFINQLRDEGLTSVEDISDALHFLTSIGELSYFGGVMSINNNQPKLGQNSNESIVLGDSGSNESNVVKVDQQAAPDSSVVAVEDDGDEDNVDEDNAMLSMDETSITAPGTDDGSLSTVEDFMASGLSQFVFLNPRWLVAAVACILRHDLDREIKETRRILESGSRPFLDRGVSFQEASLNCPVITADDALMLWQAKKITKKAAERAQAYSNNMTVTPFEFLQLLLIRFGVFVPIDLSIEKALLGGQEYSKMVEDIEKSPSKNEGPVEEISMTNEELALKAKFFFLPSLLGPGEPNESWTFKNTESWKTTLCHSVLFPDGVPPGLMERLTATVLSSVYAISSRQNHSEEAFGTDKATYEGKLTVREVLCWRTAFFLKLGTQVPSEDGSHKESLVEVFVHLAERDSHLCVGSDYMAVGTRRLIISGRGQVGNGGRKIWKGGYLLVLKCVTRVMENYGGLEFEAHGFCPECLAKKSVSEASFWDKAAIRSAVKNSEGQLRCHHHGHIVDTRFIAGPVENLSPKPRQSIANPVTDPGVPVQEMLGAVVLVGLWDGKSRKVVRAGSGVLVDKRRGLIVTAGHTLMNVWGNTEYPFGENYYGLREGKVVIGVIPDANEEGGSNKSTKGQAVFRYFAKIVAKDQSFERGECHLDACVLRITTKLENDVSGNGEECGDQPEILMLNNEHAFKAEKLQALKISEKCELEEQVRVLGFNQGGEGLLGPGESLNKFVDFARGYVCKKFVSSSGSGQEIGAPNNNRDVFKPREEIAIICPTIGGHSGGPCVNQKGEVIGILSRADPADSQRCYLSPASEWKPLIKLARKYDGSTGLLG